MTNPLKDVERRVMVLAVDVTTANLPLLEAAIRLNDANGSGNLDFHVIHVATPAEPLANSMHPAVFEESHLMSNELDRLRRLVDDMLESARDVGADSAAIENVVSHLRIGDPAHEIAQLASDFEASVIVIGTETYARNLSMPAQTFIEALARLSPCPLLLVRSRGSIPSRIEAPPCASCKAERRDSHGASLWCSRHLQQYGERHYFHHAPNSIVPPLSNRIPRITKTD
ncbi:MAG: universal stress protein [Polyangiaceae bacterium]